MKKFFAILLLACMAFGLASAEGVLLTPIHLASMENYGEEESTMRVRFDTAEAVDDELCITYEVYQTDYYPEEQVKALKKGDKVLVFAQEYEVESLEEQDGQWIMNGENGLYFSPVDEFEGMMTCDDGTETPSYTDMGTYTFPLAEQVKLSTYRMDEDGPVLDEMNEQILTPAEVKTFFAEHCDSSRNDYVSAMGSATTLRVAEGKVVEITIDWSSDS